MMDEPVLVLGKKHRQLFHDPVSALSIAQTAHPGDPNAAWAALLHLELDDICSRDPIFKKQLEFYAQLEAKSRKQANQEPINEAGKSVQTFPNWKNSKRT